MEVLNNEKAGRYFSGLGTIFKKKYMGISRIVDEEMKRGIRFDCTAAPRAFILLFQVSARMSRQKGCSDTSKVKRKCLAGMASAQ